jgi:hypothetical protein
MELADYKRDRLNELWMPQKYDLAAGFLCKDAENNEYDIFEFVVGHVNVRKTISPGYNMTLMNLEALRSWQVQEDTQEETVEEEADIEEFDEDDFTFEYERPDMYNKGDCLPMLNIGQMLEILNKCKYGKGDFYVNYREETDSYSVGKNIEGYIDIGVDYIEEELCDALWEAVKEVL